MRGSWRDLGDVAAGVAVVVALVGLIVVVS